MKQKRRRRRTPGQHPNTHFQPAIRAVSEWPQEPSADDRHSPFISACLIVRDEEANLGRCLRSIGRAVDEVIVVDTGSRDRTVEIARAHGATVFRFAWCDDFSAARNESLARARGDWLFWIDADEELIERRLGGLRGMCRAAGASVAAISVRVHCPYETTGSAETVADQLRILRNHLGIRFAGRLHEQPILPAGTDTQPVADEADLELKHWGYIPSGDLLWRKGERNRRLLQLGIEENSEDPSQFFGLGRQYAWEQRYELALEALERAIHLWSKQGGPETGYVHSMFSTAAMAALKVGQHARALQIEAAAPAEAVSSELLYTVGVSCWHLGLLDDAAARLTRAWTDPSVLKLSGTDPSTAGWRPLWVLAAIAETRGQYRQAFEYLSQAAHFAPGRPDILYTAGAMAQKAGLPAAESTRWLREAAAGEHEDDGGYRSRARELLVEIGAREGHDQPEPMLRS